MYCFGKTIARDADRWRNYQLEQAVQYHRNQLTVRLLRPSDEDESDPISHFLYSVTDLYEHALRNCDDSDMVGVLIRSEVNMRDKAIGISFRRKN